MPTIQRKPTVQAKPKLTSRVSTVSSLTANQQETRPVTAAVVSKPFSQKQQPSGEDTADFKPNWNVQRHQRNLTDKKKNVKGLKRQAPLSLEDDYDPTKPNDYEEYKEIEKRRREDEAYRRQEGKRYHSPSPEGEGRLSPRHFPPPNLYSSESPEPSKQSATPPNETVVARQPVSNIDLDISGEEAFLRRARLSNKSIVHEASSPAKSPEPKISPGFGSGEDFAHRMLAKYGWQEGQGLGKSEQGISEPLMVQKTDHRSGIIINTSSNAPVVGGNADFKNNLTQLDIENNFKSPTEEISRVILLTNMVGPGEVDDTLQEETADECNEKYGTVERCLIFEVPHGKLPDDEAVRIFIKFVNQDAAIKAQMDLNGRFFGGRAVMARFFDEGKFDKLDLAPSPAELQKS